MTKLVEKIDEWVSFAGYIIISILVFMLGLAAWAIEMPVIKYAIGIFFALGCAGTFALTVSSKPKKIPFLAASMLFAVWGIVTELYRFDSFPITHKSHIFYIIAYACLAIGMGKRCYEEYKKRKGGPPQPPIQ